MAKSKEQKHKEAVERNRKNFKQHTNFWQAWQVGQAFYNDVLKREGKEAAEKGRQNAEKFIMRYQLSAETDAHGNPLTQDQVAALKGRVYPQSKYGKATAAWDAYVEKHGLDRPKKYIDGDVVPGFAHDERFALKA